MRRKDFERERARELRLEGRSLREIARALEVSISSASVWVRDIPRGGVVSDPLPPETEQPTEEEEPTTRCGRCEETLPRSAFNRHERGRQWWCRECFRDYFRKRGDLHRRQSGDAKRKRQEVARPFIKGYLGSHPCVDCGESDPVVLEFDHVGAKRNGLSILAAGGASIRLLSDEIEQCEVVCVNCHRRRTARRGNWRRAARHWWKTPPPGDRLQSRNLAFAYSYLERNPCVDCGRSELNILDFDHVGSKTGTVLTLARNSVGLDRLQQEISQCEVRCANCHRRRTAAGQAGTHAG